MIDCSKCNTDCFVDEYVVVAAVFDRISKVEKNILTPLQLNCNHIFHYSCLSQIFHEQIRESRSLRCPTCHTFIGIGEYDASFGVFFRSNFEIKVYLKKEEILVIKEEKVNSFWIGRDLLTDLDGVFVVVD